MISFGDGLNAVHRERPGTALNVELRSRSERLYGETDHGEFDVSADSSVNDGSVVGMERSCCRRCVADESSLFRNNGRPAPGHARNAQIPRKWNSSLRYSFAFCRNCHGRRRIEVVLCSTTQKKDMHAGIRLSDLVMSRSLNGCPCFPFPKLISCFRTFVFSRSRAGFRPIPAEFASPQASRR